MKQFISIILLSFLFFANQNMAQGKRKALVGNGKEKTIRYELKSFDKLEVLWLDGNIEVEFGAEKSDISIVTDENLFELLNVKNEEGFLQLSVKNNEYNRLWVEDDKTIIKIRSTAKASEIIYKANANAHIKGIDATMLHFVKEENGDVKLEGKANTFHVEKSGNGNVDAQKLATAQAKVSSIGNGNLYIQAKSIDKERMMGNGDFQNILK